MEFGATSKIGSYRDANYLRHVLEPPYFPYAKIFGKILDFLMTALIIPILKGFLSNLRSSPAAEILPLDDSVKIHTLSGYMVIIAAVGHIAFHYADFVWEMQFHDSMLTLKPSRTLAGQYSLYNDGSHGTCSDSPDDSAICIRPTQEENTSDLWNTI